jgi:hypothetical protein
VSRHCSQGSDVAVAADHGVPDAGDKDQLVIKNQFRLWQLAVSAAVVWAGLLLAIPAAAADQPSSILSQDVSPNGTKTVCSSVTNLAINSVYCDSSPGSVTPTPTATMLATFTQTPSDGATQALTAPRTSATTPTSTATPVPASTLTPTSTATPVPTSTLTPTSTATPVASPTAPLQLTGLTVASGRSYTWASDLQVGAQQFVDRGYTFSSVPAAYGGLPFLRTANNDKQATGDTFLSFVVDRDVTVYVAHDERIRPKPDWLGAFTPTADMLTAEGSGSFRLYARTFPAGTVTLGGNAGTWMHSSMYSVLVRPVSGPVPVASPTVTSTATAAPTASRTATATLMATSTPVPTATGTPIPVASPTTPPAELRIPSASDWVEYGAVLQVGSPGAWDMMFAGASVPSTVVKRDGVYYLYYGGADGERSTDGGPRHRAIGVATSPDGVRFTKYAGNPVMTHLPNGGEEEGANSAGLVQSPTGELVMYYGGATMINRDEIVADGRLAISTDGFTFADRGRVLDHTNPALFGYGDEIFPLAAYTYDGQWYVFYLTNGGTSPRDVGVAWGPRMDHLPNSARVVDGSPEFPAHLGANVTWLGSDQVLLWVQHNWWPNIRVELRTAHPAQPTQWSAPLAVYDTPLWREHTKFFTVFLDRDRQTWFLYRTTWNAEIVLHLAPAGPTDTSPPSAPAQLVASRLADGAVALRWGAASDPDTGVVAYRISRDGQFLGQTLDLTFTDAQAPGTASSITYTVTAVNLHGTEGPAEAVTVVR